MPRVRVAVRLLLAAGLLVAVGVVLGPDRLIAALTGVDLLTYTGAVAAQLLALSLWGLSLAAVLRPVDGTPTGRTFAGAYCMGLVLRMLVPWGRSGGAVFTAVALARSSRIGIEALLAAALAADLVRFLVSLAVLAAGVALLTGTAVSAGAAPIAILFAVAASMLIVATLVVTAPTAVTRGVVAIASTLGGTVGRVSPTVSRALDPNAIADRTHRFFGTVQTLTGDRIALVTATTYAALGWSVALLPLYFSLQAAGASAPIPVIMVVVPAAGLAGIVPLPGGTGGVEVALVGLLVVMAGLQAPIAGAVAVLYRLATFWIGLVIAGLGAVLLPEHPIPTGVPEL